LFDKIFLITQKLAKALKYIYIYNFKVTSVVHSQSVSLVSTSWDEGHVCCRPSHDDFLIVFWTALIFLFLCALPHDDDQLLHAPAVHSTYEQSPTREEELLFLIIQQTVTGR